MSAIANLLVGEMIPIVFHPKPEKPCCMQHVDCVLMDSKECVLFLLIESNFLPFPCIWMQESMCRSCRKCLSFPCEGHFHRVPIMQVLTFIYKPSSILLYTIYYITIHLVLTFIYKLSPQSECCLLKDVAWVNNIEKGKAIKNNFSHSWNFRYSWQNYFLRVEHLSLMCSLPSYINMK